jgi:putative tributyrin esterase
MTIEKLEISDQAYTEQNVTMLTIHSSHIDGRQDVNIYHHKTTSKHVPIVVLLHGVYGSNWVWMNMGGVHQVYNRLREQGLNEFVLVMPSDGGLWQGSGYLPLLDKGDYEQWIMDDVLTAVRENLPEVSAQSRIFITGLSMGGYGALRLGAKYPKRFSGISAHSSVTSLNDLQQFISNPISDYQCKSRSETDLLYWFEKNKQDLPPLRFDCGQDDSLFASNNQLEKQLARLNISYSYEVFEGGHEWSYWHKHVAKSLTFFSQLVDLST